MLAIASSLQQLHERDGLCNNGGQPGVNVARALDAWEPVRTHLPFYGICHPSRNPPQSPPVACTFDPGKIYEGLGTSLVLYSPAGTRQVAVVPCALLL